MELISLLLLFQPQLRLPVAIGNRTSNITRTAISDPLMPGWSRWSATSAAGPDRGCTSAPADASPTALLHGAMHRLLAFLLSTVRDQIRKCPVCRQPVCKRA